MYRLLLRSSRSYRVPSGSPCHGYRVPLAQSPKRPTAAQLENQIKNGNLVRLVTAYRTHGHKKAHLDPLASMSRGANELAVEQYGFSPASSDVFNTDGILHTDDPKLKSATINQIVDYLEKTYCQTLAVEFEHTEEAERIWFAEAFEQAVHAPVSQETKVRAAELLAKCDTFDQFMQVRHASVKRYGAEGSESLLPFVDQLFRSAANVGINDISIGIPHRGRLNLMTILLQYPSTAIFNKLLGKRELPASSQGLGDVLSHLYQSVDLPVDGKTVHVSLLPNPSHLEAISPVALGKTRARQDYIEQTQLTEHPEQRALCLQVHGDAAVSGQGVVPETFNMANLPHYSTGGSIHLIVNNQIGFTTPSDRGRSSRYSSDAAKIVDAPVLHVNGDDPEAAVKAAALAIAYRTKFHKDIVVDLIGFRRRGHNELDDPTLTQPAMYKAIHSHLGVDKLYGRHLVHEGIIVDSHLEAVRKAYWDELDKSMQSASSYVPSDKMHLQGKWAGLTQAPPRRTITETGVDVEQLRSIGIASVTLPDSHAAVHERLARAHIEARINSIKEDAALDWATVEAMAFGSLLVEGHNVRISGQDVGRGTFSQRHLMIVDQNTDIAYVPLNFAHSRQGYLEVANSLLSEMAVVGFEYGFSIDNPNNLVIWEAQFGDFFNSAQVMFDTFVTSSESKWLRQTGLVTLLPHGYDGMGPEHSSCRLERWLQMTDSQQKVPDGDNLNFIVANPTTPAQYFHLLRRQLKRPFRKPLVVASPKLLLRHPTAKSKVHELAPGTRFQAVLDDPDIKDHSAVKHIILCSGKFYYELVKTRGNDLSTAIIRIEELAPFPSSDVKAALAKYPHAQEIKWVQEEPENQGAWSFVHPRLHFQCKASVKYVGRPALATPAAGYGELHRKQLEAVLSDAFKK